jgi:hypothetical protein
VNFRDRKIGGVTGVFPAATGYTQVSSKKISPSNLEKWAMRKKKNMAGFS